MNILVSLDSNYLTQLKVMLTSLLAENPKENFDIYILNVFIGEEELEEVRNCIDKRRNRIIDVKVPEDMFSNAPITDRYPREMYFRIFAAKLLPTNIDKILYLDPDIIIINSLKDLYEIDLKNNYYAGATHIGKPITKLNEVRLNMPSESEYINSGVLLMNLKLLREEQEEEDVFEFIKENSSKLYLPDQDVINALYGDKIITIDARKYNLGERDYMKSSFNLGKSTEKIDMKWVVNNTCIIHYYGRNKPWKGDYIGELDVFYYIYEKKLMDLTEEDDDCLKCF